MLGMYDLMDGWSRAMAMPSTLFGVSARLLDDRFFFPFPEKMMDAAPALLHARRGASATLQLMQRATKAYEKPVFGIGAIGAATNALPVLETVETSEPFVSLLRFSVPDRTDAPSILLVAPLAGHYATLLRETVRDLLPSYDVFITDWANARDVPLREGGFDLNDCIDAVIRCIRHVGPAGHVVAICQAGAPASAAIALMEAEGAIDALPASLTIMGSPIDTKRSPTAVNSFAKRYEADWFADHLIDIVPDRYPGAHRAVYPGYLQLSAFIAMNPERHQKSMRDAVHHFADGDFDSAEKIESFYGEFLSVMDLTAEFYLQTVEKVFRGNELGRNVFVSRRGAVDFAAITHTPILAIEAERDDITGLGQTRALLTLATNLNPERKHFELLEGAGHYGLFSGSRFREKLIPALKDFHTTCLRTRATPTGRTRKPAASAQTD